jgi:hypothetical protein
MGSKNPLQAWAGAKNKDASMTARKESEHASEHASNMSNRAYRKGTAEDHAAAAVAHREAAEKHSETAKVAQHEAERETEEGNARISLSEAKKHDKIADRKRGEAASKGDAGVKSGGASNDNKGGGGGGDQPRDEEGRFA